jgi:uncharacterized phage-like protein YoqJ
MGMIVCGTGHRPDKLGGYGEDVFQRLVKTAEDWLIETRPCYVITGGALGWDQALAQACINTTIRFAVYVPFVEFDCKWPQHSRDKLKAIIHKADDVKVICEAGYAGWKMQKRNEAMVDDSSLVLALWNGSSGGTANCLKYAEKKNRAIRNLISEYLNPP